MDFEEKADQLKRQWTDKYVVVDASLPELRRFAGLTGLVKTVNMSGRALVDFSVLGLEDITWYDILTDYLKVVPPPEKKPAVAAAGKAAAAKEKPAAAEGGGGAAAAAGEKEPP